MPRQGVHTKGPMLPVDISIYLLFLQKHLAHVIASGQVLSFYPILEKELNERKESPPERSKITFPLQINDAGASTKRCTL